MSPTKITRVAWREFASTVLTKGFIIGALLTPVLILAMISLVTVLAATKSEPTISGEIAVIDPTAAVAPRLADDLSPEALADAARARAERITEALKDVSGGASDLAGGLGPKADKFPTLRVAQLPADADQDAEKQRIREEAGVEDGRLALLIVHPDALDAQQDDTDRQDIELFVRPKLKDDVIDIVRDAAVGIIRDERFSRAGYDQDTISKLRDVNAAGARELTEDGGERASIGSFRNLIAYGFMMLMLIPTFIGAQYLLTNAIEEKSSRVVEILLSAVSPMELMTGKVLGQMFVGLVIMIIYGGMSMYALVRFSLGDAITPIALISMLVFFALAYFTFASFMAAVGSSVNELREAQSLIGPVMVPLMLPYGLGIFIADDPNSTFATIASFVPPISPFMMMLRVASTEPPHPWQIGLAVAISAATCYVAVWFAAKVFRVGLLMYGKPPNFRTLIKWVRMA
ncbi:MAG: ABC transporter permease [Planctomycetota bacterium]